MKTICIYDQCGEEPISFFILDGNFEHLHKVYINQGDRENQEKELDKILYDSDGFFIPKILKEFPREEFLSNPSGYKIIVVGFIP